MILAAAALARPGAEAWRAAGLERVDMAGRAAAFDQRARAAAAAGDVDAELEWRSVGCYDQTFLELRFPTPPCREVRARAAAAGRPDLARDIDAYEALWAAWTGRYADAEVLARDLLARCPPEPVEAGCRMGWVVLGGAFQEQGRFEEALAALAEARRLDALAADPLAESVAWAWTGRVCGWIGDRDCARDAATRGVALAEATNDSHTLAQALWIRGSVRQDAGDLAGALEDDRRAFAEAVTAGNVFVRTAVTVDYALVATQTGAPEAEALVAGLEGAQAAGLLPAAWAANTAYLRGALLAAQGHDEAAAERFVWAGEHVSAVWTGLQAWDAAGRAFARLGRADDAERAFAAGMAWVERGRRYTPADLRRATYFAHSLDLFRHAAFLAWDRPGEGGARRALVAADRGRARWLLDAFGGAPPDPELDVDALSRRLSDAALVEYVADGTRVLALVVDRRGVRGVELAPDPDVVALLAGRVATGSTAADLEPAASAAYDALLAPLFPDGLPPTLVVVADGPLHDVPFAALATPDGPLGVATALVEAPAAALLGRGRPRVATGVLAVAPPPAPGLPALPGAAAELALLPGVRLVGADATEEALLAGLAAGPSIVHFAGHALPDPAAPLRSALALAPGPDRGPGPGPGPRSDGRLTAAELGGASAPVDLAVLAACGADAGAPSGEGLLSLATAFRHAGARAVLASPGPLPDRATADFVRAFYDELARDGNAPRAVRHARERALEAGAPPAVWGAFRLYGDPWVRVSLPPPPPPTAWRWHGVLATALGAVVGAWVARRPAAG